jgi:AraC-like DNA-binding protein
VAPGVAFLCSSQPLEGDVSRIMRKQHDDRMSSEGRSSRQLRLVTSCLEYSERRRFDVSVEELCQRVGMCRRSVEYAFGEILGITPGRYLHICRLHGVRHDLIFAHPSETTVTAVAQHWGFSHLGRFAGVYKDHFNELPSQTLQRSPSRVHETLPSDWALPHRVPVEDAGSRQQELR